MKRGGQGLSLQNMKRGRQGLSLQAKGEVDRVLAFRT